MKLKQLDMKTAYLNAGIEEKTFLNQTPRFVEKNANGKNYVCSLKKSLYGSKHSGRNSSIHLKNFCLIFSSSQVKVIPVCSWGNETVIRTS